MNLLTIPLFWIITNVGEVPGMLDEDNPISINRKQNGALFLQVGTLANGLAYGHITTTMDLKKMRQQVQVYENIVANLIELKERFVGKEPRIKRDAKSTSASFPTLGDSLQMYSAVGNVHKTPVRKKFIKTTSVDPEVEIFLEFENTSSKSEHDKQELSQNRIIAEQLEGLIHWIQLQVKETYEAIDNTLASFEKAGAVAKPDRPKRHTVPPYLPMNTRNHMVTVRKKRGATLVIGAAAGIAALGGIISSLFGHFSTSDLEAVVEKKTNVLAMQIEENIVKFSEVDRDIKQLNSSLGEAISTVFTIINKNHGRDLQHIALYHAWGITENLRIIRKAVHGIIEAHQGHFSSNLVKPMELQKALTTMRNKAIENGKEIGIRTLADVYSLSTSYLYEVEKQRVNIIIHCPISDIGKDLNLFRYIAAPLVWETGKEAEHPFVEIASTQEYIGLSKDQTMYRTFTADDLEECLRIEQVHFCDNLATYKVARPSCLSGLLMNKMNMVREHCQINTKADATRAVSYTHLTLPTILLL